MGKIVPKRIVSNQKRLAEWIAKNAYTQRAEGDFVGIRIHQVHAKSKVGDEVARYDIPPKGERNETWNQDLTVDIMQTLHAEASQFGGLQHYACYSLFSETDDTVNRTVVAITGESDDDDDELLSEAPNTLGLTQQAMRHQEANARIMSASILQVLDAQRRQNDKLMEMNQNLMTTQMQQVKDMTEMWEERRALILNTNVENLKAHSMQEGVSFLKKIGPVLVNQMVGKDLLPVDKAAGVTSMARSLYGSLTAEQMEALNKVLRQDQMMHFMTMGETLIDDSDDNAEQTKEEK